MGVGYLTLDRPTTTLSGGEAHRIRLAGQIGGAHAGHRSTSWTSRRWACTSATTSGCSATLNGIRDLGNTVVVVEHDEETIRAADYVVDLGEGAGRQGGRLMYQGPPGLDRTAASPAATCAASCAIPVPARAPRRRTGTLRILGAREHNLRGHRRRRSRSAC